MATDPRIGTLLGPYRIESRIGRGGMGVVYLAEHVSLGRKVALKVLSPELSEDEDFRRRFRRESKVAARLDHPGIVQVYDAGEADDTLFIAMRYVHGRDLRRVLDEEGPLDSERVLSIVSQAADALDEAHAEGLVHRDVKPGNILLAPSSRGPAERVFLSDFGLAKHAVSASHVTRTGYFVGTIHYSSPEQLTAGEVDARTDVYSLGCVAYECLTGRVPFDRPHEPAVMYAHLNDQPPRPSEQRRDLPRAVDETIATAMAKDPVERFASCGEMASALRVALEGAQAAETAPMLPAPTRRREPATRAEATRRLPGRERAAPPERRRRRRFLPWVAAAGALLIAATAAVVIPSLREEGGGGDDDGGVVAAAPDRILLTRGPMRSGEIYAVSADGNDLLRYTTNSADDGNPDWSPDRTRIAFQSNREGNDDIYLENADNTGLTRLTNSTADERAPDWSPDGNQIAFASDLGEDPGVFDIFVMNADGSDPARELTTDPVDGNAPDWSPDGTQIVFTSEYEGDGDSDIYVMAADGSNVRNLTDDPSDDMTPVWSPDGTQIAFASDRGGDPRVFDIFVMNADGSDPREVTVDPADGTHPSWSPDGTQIAFASDHEGNYDVYVMDAPGGVPTNVTRSKGPDKTPAWW